MADDLPGTHRIADLDARVDGLVGGAQRVAAGGGVVDGRPASDDRDLQLVDSSDAQSATITIPEHDCTISVVAENEYGAGEVARAELPHRRRRVSGHLLTGRKMGSFQRSPP